VRFCIYARAGAAGGGTTIKLRAISLLNTYQHKSVVQLNALKMKRKIEFPPPFLRALLEMRIKLLLLSLGAFYHIITTRPIILADAKTTNSLSPSWRRRSIFAFRIFLFAAQQNQDDTIFSLTPDSLKKAQPLLFNLTNKLLK
jgi:hypothetical protein